MLAAGGDPDELIERVDKILYSNEDMSPQLVKDASRAPQLQAYALLTGFYAALSLTFLFISEVGFATTPIKTDRIFGISIVGLLVLIGAQTIWWHRESISDYISSISIRNRRSTTRFRKFIVLCILLHLAFCVLLLSMILGCMGCSVVISICMGVSVAICSFLWCIVFFRDHRSATTKKSLVVVDGSDENGLVIASAATPK